MMGPEATLYGQSPFGFTMPDNTLDGGWLNNDKTIVLHKNTTNIVYVGITVGYDVDWKTGDKLTFVSDGYCKFRDENGKSIFATGTVSNTVEIVTSSKPEISVSNDIVTIHASVPSRYDGYQLQESEDLVSWSFVPGTKDLERTIMMGDFQFVLPKGERNKFFRLISTNNP
jgi:hypothetical protein